VGGDCPGKTELHADVLQASKVFVEFEPQTRIEGDLQQMDASFAVTELWRVLDGQAHGRDSAEQITLFDSVGFALEDYSALRYLHAQAQALFLGADVSLIPALDDPKDLYQLVRPASTAAVYSNEGVSGRDTGLPAAAQASKPPAMDCTLV
jgi:ornithine cyclodeaminase